MFYQNPLDRSWLQHYEGRSGNLEKFEEYYPATATGTYPVEYEGNLYRGGNVVWNGIEGHMVRVPSENVVWNSQNLLDGDKLIAIAEGINSIRDYDVIFTAAWGEIHKVTLEKVKESIEYQKDTPYEVLTTGDEELDEFLIDPGEVIITYHDTDEPEKFCEKLQEFREAVQDAVDNEEGDLGDWHFTPVDGHHRLFGAILSGEPYVWVMLSGNQISSAQRGETEDDRERAEMLE